MSRPDLTRTLEITRDITVAAIQDSGDHRVVYDQDAVSTFFETVFNKVKELTEANQE